MSKKANSLLSDVEEFLQMVYRKKRASGKYIDDVGAEAFVALGEATMNFINATERHEVLAKLCPTRKSLSASDDAGRGR